MAEVKPQRVNGVVTLGSRVVFSDGDGRCYTVELVRPDEIDLEKGRISPASPLGRALLGKRAGERIWVETPAGKQGFEILSVETQR